MFDFLAGLFTKKPAPTVTPIPVINLLAGLPFRYLIGADYAFAGMPGTITVVPYGHAKAFHGITIGYCNLFDELNTGEYGPYLHTSDTAAEYNEGQIDPTGPGWIKNLSEQFRDRQKQGIEFVELDNPDAYNMTAVRMALDYAWSAFKLKCVAKNPGLCPEPVKYLAHSNVYGAIVENGAGSASQMDKHRREAGKPDLPVWFVFFNKGNGRMIADDVVREIREKRYRNMGVTFSSARAEYGSSEDLLRPSEV